MAKGYLPVLRDQPALLPVDMRDWLPDSDLVWFVLEVVAELDLDAFHRRRRLGGAGRAAFDPQMLVALLVYAYGVGERSSRQIERLCGRDVAFRIIVGGGGAPDHSTVARFRAEHESALEGLFGQVLKLCVRAGLGRVGIVAVDGTKIAANASINQNRSVRSVEERARQVLREAAEVDAAEDAMFGDARGDELSGEWADPRGRKDKICQALEEIRRRDAAPDEQDPGQQLPEQGAKAAAADVRRYERLAAAAAESRRRLAVLEAEQQAKVAADRARREAAKAAGAPVVGGAPPKARTAAMGRVERRAQRLAKQAAAHQNRIQAREHRAQQRQQRQAEHRDTQPVNLTDPQSRVMPTHAGWVQGYNAQLAVSADHLILAVSLNNNPVDVGQYQPMVSAAADALTAAGHPAPNIGTVLADAGYLSDANLTCPGPDRLIATGKHRTLEADAATGITQTHGQPTPRERMRQRLATADGITAYRRRAGTVEPVHAHLKDRRGLRRFSRRGLQAATSELTFAAAVTNLLRHYQLQLA